MRRSLLLAQRCCRHTATNRRADGSGVSLNVSHHIVARRERIRIGRVIGEAGKAHVPVRTLKAKRIPPFASPALGHAPAFEYDVLPAASAKAMAHRQAGLTSSYDHGFNGFHIQSALMPTARTTFAHFSVSPAMCMPNWMGVKGAGVALASASRPLTVGFSKPAATSRLRRSMISEGVPCGAPIPYQELVS